MLTNAIITSYSLRSGSDSEGQPTYAAAVAGSWACLAEPRKRKLLIAGREVVASLSVRVGNLPGLPALAVGDRITIDGIASQVLSCDIVPGSLGHRLLLLG
jgi:hypothetical protein